jgi:5-formyltetrahydrofolate cyclo-ligase
MCGPLEMELEGFSQASCQTKKERWRKQMSGMRRAITKENHQWWSQHTCRRLSGLLDVLGARSVGVYSAVIGEVDLAWLWSMGDTCSRFFYFPRISDGSLAFHLVRDPEKELRPGVFGIPAPLDSLPSKSPSALDVMVLPGLAYDRFGNRIGSGAGFYDRLLGSLNIRPCLVGSGFSSQMVWEGSLPSGPYDVSMDWIATSRECVRSLSRVHMPRSS